MRTKTLNDLGAGEGGTIIRINGGVGMVNRLAAMDIRPGTIITKLNSGLMQGPVTTEVNRTQIAIGFGIASRILVEVEDSKQ